MAQEDFRQGRDGSLLSFVSDVFRNGHGTPAMMAPGDLTETSRDSREQLTKQNIRNLDFGTQEAVPGRFSGRRQNPQVKLFWVKGRMELK